MILDRDQALLAFYASFHTARRSSAFFYGVAEWSGIYEVPLSTPDTNDKESNSPELTGNTPGKPKDPIKLRVGTE